MNTSTNKSIKKIQLKMQDMDKNSVRYQALQHAREFKASWIGLGRALYTVWKDKLYRDWGFGNFDAYTSKEIGIRKQTALKLLRSYYFLEKEEPQYLQASGAENTESAPAPAYESVDLLRRASRRKELNKADYADLKNKLFDSGKDVNEVKKGLTALIRQRQELEPEEAWQKKRMAFVRRLLGTLKALRTELKATKALPEQILKETEKLIGHLESEIS